MNILTEARTRMCDRYFEKSIAFLFVNCKIFRSQSRRKTTTCTYLQLLCDMIKNSAVLRKSRISLVVNVDSNVDLQHSLSLVPGVNALGTPPIILLLSLSISILIKTNIT